MLVVSRGLWVVNVWGTKVVAATVVVWAASVAASVVSGACVVVGASVVVVVGSGMNGGAARLAGRSRASWKDQV